MQGGWPPNQKQTTDKRKIMKNTRPESRVKNIRVNSYNKGQILSITIYNDHGQQCVANFDLLSASDLNEIRQLLGEIRYHAFKDTNDTEISK